MNQIEKAINDLSSPNKNKRYEACEELRVTDSLPESAIAALEAATQDPDPLVAEAARRALASHKPPSTSRDYANISKDQETSFPIDTKHKIPQRLYLLWALGGITGLFVLSTILIFRPSTDLNDPSQLVAVGGACILGAVIGAILGIILGRIGYAIKPSTEISIGVAALGPILIIALLAGFFILREANTANRLQEMYPEPKPFHPLHATFHELTRAEAADHNGPLLCSGIDLDPSTAQEVANLEIPGDVRSVAFNPDGRLLAADQSDQITLWDRPTLKRVGRLNTDGVVFGMAFSPDGSRLAVILYQGQNDGEVIGLWDVNTQQSLVGTRAPDGTYNIGFSPDGQKLITPGLSSIYTGYPSIYLWDANSLEPLGSLIGPLAEESSDACFLPDGRVLARYNNYNKPDRIGIWTIESP